VPAGNESTPPHEAGVVASDSLGAGGPVDGPIFPPDEPALEMTLAGEPTTGIAPPPAPLPAVLWPPSDAGRFRRRMRLWRREAHDYHRSSRVLLLAWCLWLLGNWTATLVVFWAVPARPAMRWMMLSGALGLLVFWPALRLSQGAPAPSLGQVLRDWLSLNLVFQAVIWMLWYTNQWKAGQTFWLDAAIICWSLLAGALLGWGTRFPRGRARVTAMALCLLLVFAEPAVLLLGRHLEAAWRMRISPLGAMWALTDSPADAVIGPWTGTITCAGVAAVVAWAGLFAFFRRPRRGAHPGANPGARPGASPGASPGVHPGAHPGARA
jgi:hypothetical protein